jgi:hypothetical protein
MSEESPNPIERFQEQFLEQFQGMQRIVMEGVENLGNVTLAVGEGAVRGIGAIASLVGLGSLVPSSSASNARSPEPSGISSPIITNYPVQAPAPLVSNEQAISMAMKNTIDPIKNALGDLLENERKMAPTLAMKDVGSEIYSSAAPQTPAMGISRSTGMGTNIG